MGNIKGAKVEDILVEEQVYLNKRLPFLTTLFTDLAIGKLVIQVLLHQEVFSEKGNLMGTGRVNGKLRILIVLYSGGF